MSEGPDLSKLAKAGVKSLRSQGEFIELQSADDIIKLEAHNARKSRGTFRPRRVRLDYR